VYSLRDPGSPDQGVAAGLFSALKNDSAIPKGLLSGTTSAECWPTGSANAPPGEHACDGGAPAHFVRAKDFHFAERAGAIRDRRRSE